MKNSGRPKGLPLSALFGDVNNRLPQQQKTGVGTGLRTVRPKLLCNFGISRREITFIAYGDVICYANHRTVEDAGPYIDK